jgi:hypothetical protein
LKGTKQIQSHRGKVYVRFNNIRDTCLFSQNARLGGPDWVISYVHPREYAQVSTKPTLKSQFNHYKKVVDPTSGLITAHEGQLALAVFAPQSLQNVDRGRLVHFVHELLMEQGDLFSFKIDMEGVKGSVLSAVVEYCDNDVSLRAVSELHGKVVEVSALLVEDRLLCISDTSQGFQVCMTLHRPDIPTMALLSSDRMSNPPEIIANSLDFASNIQRLTLTNRVPSSVSSFTPGFLNTPSRSPSAPTYQIPASYGMVPFVYHGMPLNPPYMPDPVSPRVQNMFPSGNYSWVGPVYPQQSTIMSPELVTPRQFAYHRADGRRQNAVRVHRSPYQHHNVSGQHNHVDVDRIREGIDVRTTVSQSAFPRI